MTVPSAMCRGVAGPLDSLDESGNAHALVEGERYLATDLRQPAIGSRALNVLPFLLAAALICACHAYTALPR